MKIIKRINGMVIAQAKDGSYSVFTREEYAYGEGCRYAEFEDIDNLEEAITQAKHF